MTPYTIRCLIISFALSLSTSAIAGEKEETWRKGAELCDGIFCELSGGTYLNAIYEHNSEQIKRLDETVNKSIERRFAAIASLSDRLGEKQQAFSLLPVLADTYLKEYGSHYARSCKSNIIEKTVTKRNSTYGMYDNTGFKKNQKSAKPQAFIYTLPTRLERLCDRVCDNSGGKAERYMIKTTGNTGAMNTLSAVNKLMTNYKCDSQEVKQFEQNLETLTNQYLDEYH